MITDISVIIPARNEEENLKKIIPKIIHCYNRHLREIIIVDDNSTDKTYSTSIFLQKKYPKIKIYRRKAPFGVGLAIRDGIANLSPYTKYVLFIDSDFIINVPDIAQMIQKIEKSDGVTGSRFSKKNSLTNYPFPKFVANRTYHLLAKLLLGARQNDLTNNFKLYRYGLVKKIEPFLKSNDFAINAEIGYYPAVMGAKIAQVPVRWQERDKNMGLSKFKILRVGPSYLSAFLRLARYKFRNEQENLPSEY
jgi:glycosyltransferase involved in cell wall biosynthesis